MIPVWDQTLPTLIGCRDATLALIGGVPTYVLTDNPRTVTVDHVAGVPVRHPQIVQVGRYYGTQVHTCVPYDLQSKGGSEFTVRIAKADLVPAEANLREHYASFAALEAACAAFCAKVNERTHRESARVPDQALVEEQQRLHVAPAAPHTAALGVTRTVGTDQTIRFGSVRYSTPPGLVGAEVGVRVAGEELVVVADLDTFPVAPGWAAGRAHRGRPPPALDPGQSADRSGPLPRPPAGPHRRPAPAPATGPLGGRSQVPRSGCWGPRLVDRGLHGRGRPDPGEDGRR